MAEPKTAPARSDEQPGAKPVGDRRQATPASFDSGLTFMSHATGNLLTLVAIGVVALVLFAGLFNMLRGGNPNTSQLLMRWRIGLQFFAIVVIMIVLFFRG